MEHTATETAAFSERLLAWYDIHRRSMPWRGTKDPYAVWVSETMLQQTRVETVIPYFRRFMEAFPDIRTLAEADTGMVLKLWEGLGYYQRARNLQKGAQQVTDQFHGSLPRDAEALRRISGIGPYTAGAIASIAFGLPEPAVDGNVIRVISRAFGIRENTGIPSVRRMLSDTVRRVIPPERPGDFNQALMDLGAGICVPGTPDCDLCPLRELCDALAAGDEEELPVLPRKNPPKEERWDVLILLDESGRVLLYQRPEKLLQGLWCFPMLPGGETAAALPAAIRRKWRLKAEQARYLRDARHIFTHRVWQMKLWTARVRGEAPDGMRFCSEKELQALPLPTAVKAARTEACRLMQDGC